VIVPHPGLAGKPEKHLEAAELSGILAPRMTQPCDVVILCGGAGTRLRDVVADRPKPMADVSGMPFLSLLIEHIASFGFRRFVLCVGHKSEVIESYFRSGCGDVSIVLSREQAPLGTGGALWNARPMIHGRTFVALNGDSFCPVDYPCCLQFHAARSASATIAVTPVRDAAEYGTVEVADQGRIASFGEKSRREKGLVNAGVYAFETEVLDRLTWPVPFSLERDVFPCMAANGRLSGWRTAGPLLDIGTPERYRDAQSRLIPLMRNRQIET